VIPEFGHFALILAMCLAFVQASVPLWGASRQNVAYMNTARATAKGQFVFVALSFLALAYSFLTNDFSVAYVAENSNTNLPWLYRICAIWSAHEGSLLLWLAILSFWSAAVSIFSRQLPLEMVARVLAVLALISIGFYLFLLTTSDPFIRLLPNIPVNGSSINPILQDPGLAVHPPMLYMGYVGFSVAFAFAIAALMSGRLDATWARWSRPWTMIAWCFLTLGIVLGSWWAYRELGWGGWWFWDPVENASFLPWLVGTALLHSLIVTEKRNVFKAWTVLLAVTAFSLSLLGTFLVRSGILISVHAFAVDPKRGLYLLRFLMVVVGGSLLLYAWRGRKIVNTGSFHLLSRESALLANNVLLFVAMVTILLGTLYPLIISALGLAKLSVGAPYFNAVFVPLMIPTLLLMGIAPWMHWQSMPRDRWPKKIIAIFVGVVLLAIALPFLVGAKEQITVIVGLALALWVMMNSAASIRWKRLTRSQLPLLFAHVGVGVTVIGLVLTTAYSQQKDLSLKPGAQVALGPYHFVFDGVARLTGPDYSGYQGIIRVYRGQQLLNTLYPQVRSFPVQQISTTKSAIDASIFRDLYVAIGNSLPGEAWSVRLYYKPFVRWIWAGGFLMVIGGLISLSDRRYRKRQGENDEQPEQQ